MPDIYKAHVNDETGEIQTVKEHCEGTAKLCAEFAVPELKTIMEAIGLLHDVGKYQKSFQRRINKENINVEHSTCGAVAAKEIYPPPLSLIMGYCIAGHHSGLPDGGFINDDPSLSTLHGRMGRSFEDYSEYKNEMLTLLPELNNDVFYSFLMKDYKNKFQLVDKFAFLTRYCFSCLTDADSIDTAKFCGTGVNEHLKANFEKCLQKVDDRLNSFICKTELQKTRKVLQQQVFEKTDNDAEIYLMNMPTGSGKTLCSVKFALERAIKKNKKRIIYVIPYNSIIDQTAGEFEDLFGKDAEILRHQSSFSYEDRDDFDENYKNVLKSAAENWDAPLIITTAVQFFESVYSNKRGKLRKMHNIADSILIFDEAHLMPQDYLQPCLQAIAFAARYLNSEAVFLTATMPDFKKLLEQYALSDSRILDMVQDTGCFSAFEKCSYEFAGEVSDEELLEKASSSPTSLIIVNSKRKARELYKKCGDGKNYHLSTYMTSRDRKRVIDKIKEELSKLEEEFPAMENVPDESRITIISTSLIEAGVDLDVCTVFRELTGLDSILQSGGRCNREGKRKGAFTYVFKFADEARSVSRDEKFNLTKGIIKKYDNINSGECIKEYYDRLFFLKEDNITKNAMSRRCSDIRSIPFRKYSEEFNLIDSYTEYVVVQQDENSKSLVEELKYKRGIKARKLQQYTCTVSRAEFEELLKQHVIDDYGSGIWCLTNLDYYNEDEGIRFEPTDYII